MGLAKVNFGRRTVFSSITSKHFPSCTVLEVVIFLLFLYYEKFCNIYFLQ